MSRLLEKQRIVDQLVKALEIKAEEAEKILDKFDTDFKKIRLISPIDFLIYFESKLPKDEKTLRTLFYISTLESVIAAKKSHKQKVDLVAKAVIKYLSKDEKIKLIGGFLFSKTYTFGSGKFSMRHLMFGEMMRDKDFNKYGYIESQKKFCSTGYPNYLCRCTEWLEKKDLQDKFIPDLVKRLLEMRGAMLHEAFPVLWFPDYDPKPEVTMYSSTLVDAHPTQNHPLIFRSYESGIDSAEFYKWIKKVILGHIRDLAKIDL